MAIGNINWISHSKGQFANVLSDFKVRASNFTLGSLSQRTACMCPQEDLSQAVWHLVIITKFKKPEEWPKELQCRHTRESCAAVRKNRLDVCIGTSNEHRAILLLE